MKTGDVVLGVTAVVVGYLLFKPGAAPPPTAKATLSVDTTPVKGGIYLNGVYQGIAPMTFELNPGTYEVGFGDVQGWITPQVYYSVLHAGGITAVTGTYEPVAPPPEHYSLGIATSPEVNAPISVDGITIGTTPVSVSLAAGTHTVAITVPSGYYLDHWEDGTGAVVGTGTTLSISLEQDATLVAFVSQAPPTGGDYVCDICGESFATLFELMQHMITEHPGAWNT
jgi:hypothetical protein